MEDKSITPLRLPVPPVAPPPQTLPKSVSPGHVDTFNQMEVTATNSLTAVRMHYNFVRAHTQTIAFIDAVLGFLALTIF